MDQALLTSLVHLLLVVTVAYATAVAGYQSIRRDTNAEHPEFPAGPVTLPRAEVRCRRTAGLVVGLPSARRSARRGRLRAS